MYMDTHWCRNPNLKPVTYDPELSKKLLADAGYPNGLKISGYMSNLPDSVTRTEAIKNMLAQVGIDWKVDVLDNVAISDRMKNVEYDLAQGGWSYIKDPDMMASGLYHPDGGFNFGRSNNPEAIALVEAGNAELDMDKRQKIYWELERVLYENYEDAWLYWPLSNTARRLNLLGNDSEMQREGQETYWFSHPEYLKDGKE
jgi:peptide/nickel transport system substrate-binding protein